MIKPNEIIRLLNDEIILVKPRLKRRDSTTRKIRTKIRITILKKSENNKAESKRKGSNGLFWGLNQSKSPSWVYADEVLVSKVLLLE